MDYSLKMLCAIMGVPIYKYNKKQQVFHNYGAFEQEYNVFINDNLFLDQITKDCVGKKYPVIQVEQECIYMSAMEMEVDEFVFVGPVCIGQLSNIDLHQFYKTHKLKGNEVHPFVVHLTRVIALIGLIFHNITGEELKIEEILEANKLTSQTVETLEQDITTLNVTQIEDDLTHHSYLEELRLTGYIKNGNQEGVSEVFDLISGNTSKLSNKITSHYRNLAICIVTVATRAAMEGGVSPSQAYALSDIYIHKIDSCNQVAQLYALMKASAKEFTAQVIITNGNRAHSNYIEQCKEYIVNNYHHKMELEVIAKSIGVNKNYLSHLFTKEEGMTMKEYVNRIRVKKAENLLKYSEATLTQIADYLSFSSQSHFGSVFKKYLELTPQQYRDRYKTSEFISKEMSDQMVTGENFDKF